MLSTVSDSIFRHLGRNFQNNEGLCIAHAGSRLSYGTVFGERERERERERDYQRVTSYAR
jgi:hypothetical protein